jgi:hypothetical protein
MLVQKQNEFLAKEDIRTLVTCDDEMLLSEVVPSMLLTDFGAVLEANVEVCELTEVEAERLNGGVLFLLDRLLGYVRSFQSVTTEWL